MSAYAKSTELVPRRLCGEDILSKKNVTKIWKHTINKGSYTIFIYKRPRGRNALIEKNEKALLRMYIYKKRFLEKNLFCQFKFSVYENFSLIMPDQPQFMAIPEKSDIIYGCGPIRTNMAAATCDVTKWCKWVV